MWHIDRILVALLILLEIVYSAGARRKHNVYCKNNNAEDVNWYVIYKLPKTKEIKHPPSYYINPKGDEIAYFDSDMAKNKKTPLWRESKPGIYDVRNPVAYTLMPLFAKTISRDIAYVTYNDQVPEGFHGTRGGHSKGVLMVGHSTSVWLQHSVPRFPEMLHEGIYIYPPSGRENAQLFLCLTVPTMTMVEVIAYHLRVQYANVCQRHFAWIREDNYPQLFMLLNYIYVTGSTSLANHTMITERRQLIQSIAKRSIWKHDIYRNIVAPYMVKGDLLVESWRNGAGGTVDKSCAYYSVIDVKTVRIQFESGWYTVFNYTEDHSKWAVAIYKPFFCFSSLNRMMSQFNRGGEVTCMQNKNLADLFRNSIVDEDACTSSKGKQKSRKS